MAFYESRGGELCQVEDASFGCRSVNVVGEWEQDSGGGQEFLSKLHLVYGLTVYSNLTGDFLPLDRVDHMVDFLGSVRGYAAGGSSANVVEPTTYKPYGGVLSGGISLRYGWTGNTTYYVS